MLCRVRSALQQSVPAYHLAAVANFAAARNAVAALAGFAPVVVLGKEPPAGLSALIASGAADFVAADELHFPDAAACVEKHLHSARRQLHKSSGSAAPTSALEFARNESFAE